MRHLPAVALAVAVTVAAVSACSSHTNPRASRPDTVSGVDAGRRIFDNGTDGAGNRIGRSGGVGMMRGSAGCASCHGPDGRGRTTPMVRAPNITYANLTDPAGMVELDGSRGHSYTDDEIRRAVTQGIGANGDQLDDAMPRWNLTDQEWQDLLTYLKTLN